MRDKATLANLGGVPVNGDSNIEPTSDILQLVVREDLLAGAYCGIYGGRELIPMKSDIAAFQTRRALSAGEPIAVCNGLSEDLISIIRYTQIKTYYQPKQLIETDLSESADYQKLADQVARDMQKLVNEYTERMMLGFIPTAPHHTQPEAKNGHRNQRKKI